MAIATSDGMNQHRLLILALQVTFCGTARANNGNLEGTIDLVR